MVSLQLITLSIPIKHETLVDFMFISVHFFIKSTKIFFFFGSKYV